MPYFFKKTFVSAHFFPYAVWLQCLLGLQPSIAVPPSAIFGLNLTQLTMISHYSALKKTIKSISFSM